MGRTSNEVCDVCGKEFYRRPFQKKKYEHAYCSMVCYGKSKTNEPRDCLTCGKAFHAKRKTQMYCSVSCASRKLKPRHGRYSRFGGKEKSGRV